MPERGGAAPLAAIATPVRTRRMSSQPRSESRPLVPPRSERHVLIVEDEPVIASLLADVLTSRGYRVTQVHTVADGLASAARHADLALCVSDFLLPDRTGLDFARELKELRPALRVVLA